MVGVGHKLPWAPRSSTPLQLKERLDAERTGLPHVVYRDPAGNQVVGWLDDDVVTVGRIPTVGICLSWDPGVSRVHAELHRLEDIWTLNDDGLSRNGSFVNGDRVVGRHRLEDCDVHTFGSTSIVFRAPGPSLDSTESARPRPVPTHVTPTERCLLAALCRPVHERSGPYPATNRQIADELYLSIPAVKRRLGVLFERFEIADLPHNEKRARLADLALRAGIVTPADF